MEMLCDGCVGLIGEFPAMVDSSLAATISGIPGAPALPSGDAANIPLRLPSGILISFSGAFGSTLRAIICPISGMAFSRAALGGGGGAASAAALLAAAVATSTSGGFAG